MSDSDKSLDLRALIGLFYWGDGLAGEGCRNKMERRMMERRIVASNCVNSVLVDGRSAGHVVSA